MTENIIRGLHAAYGLRRREMMPTISDEQLESEINLLTGWGRTQLKHFETQDELDAKLKELSRSKKNAATLRGKNKKALQELNAEKDRTATRNRAGAVAKNKKLNSVKDIAKATYADLHKKLGKPPALDAFIDELKKRKPSGGGDPFVNNWWGEFTGPNGTAESTVKKWLSKLVKGRGI